MIHIVGIGPGDQGYITSLGQKLIKEAEVVIGASRQLESVKTLSQGTCRELDKKLSDLVTFLYENSEKQIVLLASGDPLIYGIGKYLGERLPKDKLQIVPGISSIQYLFSKIGLDMNDLYITSSHGKVPDFDKLLDHEKVAMVTDNIIGPYAISQEILKRNLKKVMVIGENLSYESEKITVIKPELISQEMTFDMNVVVIIDEK